MTCTNLYYHFDKSLILYEVKRVDDKTRITRLTKRQKHKLLKQNSTFYLKNDDLFNTLIKDNPSYKELTEFFKEQLKDFKILTEKNGNRCFYNPDDIKYTNETLWSTYFKDLPYNLTKNKLKELRSFRPDIYNVY